jgi:hypothetical protein
LVEAYETRGSSAFGGPHLPGHVEGSPEATCETMNAPKKKHRGFESLGVHQPRRRYCRAVPIRAVGPSCCKADPRLSHGRPRSDSM